MVSLIAKHKTVFSGEIRTRSDASEMARYLLFARSKSLTPIQLDINGSIVAATDSWICDAIGEKIIKAEKPLRKSKKLIDIFSETEPMTPHQKKIARLIDRVETEIDTIKAAQKSIRAAEKQLQSLNANVDFFHQLNDVGYQVDEIGHRVEDLKRCFRGY